MNKKVKVVSTLGELQETAPDGSDAVLVEETEEFHWWDVEEKKWKPIESRSGAMRFLRPQVKALKLRAQRDRAVAKEREAQERVEREQAAAKERDAKREQLVEQQAAARKKAERDAQEKAARISRGEE